MDYKSPAGQLQLEPLQLQHGAPTVIPHELLAAIDARMAALEARAHSAEDTAALVGIHPLSNTHTALTLLITNSRNLVACYVLVGVSYLHAHQLHPFGIVFPNSNKKYTSHHECEVTGSPQLILH